MPVKKEVNVWRDRITSITKDRRKKERLWRRNRRYYDFEGNHWSDIADVEVDEHNIPFDRVAFNLVRSNTKRIIPAIFFRNPKALVTPKRDQDVKQAPFVEKLLNYTIEQIGLKQQAKRVALDALLSYGVMKIGFDSEFRIASPGKKDDRTENLNVTPSYIWNLRVDPFDFYIDPRANYIDLSDAEYVIHKVRRLLQDVKDDPFYQNTSDLKPSIFVKFDHEKEIEQKSFDDTVSKDSREMIDLWEIWDRKEKQFIIMAEGHDKLLKKDDWPYELEGFPFETLSFDFTPGELYGKTDVDNYISAQQAANILISIILEHAERALPRILLTGQVTDDELNQLKQPLVDGIVRVRQGNIIPFNPAPLNQDTLNGLTLLRDIMNVESGVNEFQRGLVPRGTRTATAASIINQSSQVIQSEQVDIIQDFFKNLLRKDLKLMQQAYDIERIIPIVGNEPGVFEFKSFTKEEIQGEFDITIEPFSAVPKNLELEKQQELQYTNLMMGAFPQIVDQVELAKNLSEAFRKKNVSKIIPQAEQRSQAEGQPKDPETENMLLATGADVEVFPTEPHNEHMQSHQIARDTLAANGAEDFILQKFDAHIQVHNQMQVQQALAQLAGQQPNGQQPGGAFGRNLGVVPGLTPGGGQVPLGPAGQFGPTGMQAEEQAEEFG